MSNNTSYESILVSFAYLQSIDDPIRFAFELEQKQKKSGLRLTTFRSMCRAWTAQHNGGQAMPNLPELPAWLDDLLDQPFSRENSLTVAVRCQYASSVDEPEQEESSQLHCNVQDILNWYGFEFERSSLKPLDECSENNCQNNATWFDSGNMGFCTTHQPYEVES